MNIRNSKEISELKTKEIESSVVDMKKIFMIKRLSRKGLMKFKTYRNQKIIQLLNNHLIKELKFNISELSQKINEINFEFMIDSYFIRYL